MQQPIWLFMTVGQLSSRIPALQDRRLIDWWSMSTFSVLNRWKASSMQRASTVCTAWPGMTARRLNYICTSTPVTRHDALGLGRQKVVVMSLTLWLLLASSNTSFSQFNRSANTYMLHTAYDMSMKNRMSWGVSCSRRGISEWCKTSSLPVDVVI